jgi:hypothetical protein
MAPRVAGFMARERSRDGAWQTQQVESFEEVARNYCPKPG